MQNLIARTHAALTPNAKSGQKGVTAIEYGLIAALIAVVVIGAYAALGGSLETVIGDVASEVDSVSGGDISGSGGGGGGGGG